MASLSSKTAVIWVGLVVLIMLQGCTVATKHTLIAPEIHSLFKGKYEIGPAMEKEKQRPKSVAVLPFVNKAESQRGSEEVRRGFYNHFSSMPFNDMQLFRVDNALRKAGLTDPLAINKMKPEELGKILGVDAVVYGEITDFDKLFLAIYSQVAVGAKVRMYDAKTGAFLWSGEHTARIHEGGISTTPLGIIATIVATSLNMRDIQLLRACDDLFRDMVKTIPAPSIAEALQPPPIMLLTQDTKNLPKKAGDEIKVVIQGAPKMLASFDIGDYRKQIDMKEVEPGWYLGVYKVVPGDNVRKAIITGRLSYPNEPGNFSEWIDAVGTVTLKTTPPDTPKRFAAVGRNKLVQLRWNKASDPDLIGYRVYRSATPLAGYLEIARTEFTEYRDQAPELVNDRKYFYRVSSVDLAGNESEKSDAITGMPVTPGPTPVSGIIDADRTWYSGASPYVIESAVTVKDKAVLTIEPGTEIRSKGGALIVEGQLKAEGDGEHVILFDAAAEGGTWKGIVFKNVKDKENNVRYLRVRNAEAGITCEASSPRIEHSELAENLVAVRIAGAFSKPRISHNTIQKNREAAVMVFDGAQPVITENRIIENEKGGILVKGSSPVIVHNEISRNRGSGVVLQRSQASVTENNITDNEPFNMSADMTGESVPAMKNWWGTAKGADILASIKGKINVGTVLNAPWPGGKDIELPILASSLGGAVKADSFLILANSPYRVVQDVVIDGGATLYVEAGVEIRYGQNRAINVEDGGIMAKGTKAAPIVFTASTPSPSPGFYSSAVRFLKKTQVNSAFSYCIVKYAETAFDIHYGAPDFSYCHIAHNAQSGLFCRNDSAPKITYNTFTGNRGEGAIKSVGMSRPFIQHNNFVNNEVAVQTFSTIYIDASNNWWGRNPPDLNIIWGDPDKNIKIKPWLTTPERQAFSEKK